MSQSDASRPSVGATKRDKGVEFNPANEAAKLRELMISSANRTMYKQLAKQVPNPIWMEFPTKCVQEVESVEHMKQLLDHHTHSADVMVVRYWQEYCTACNALDKMMEALCHQSRQDYPGAHFYNVKKEDHPDLVKGMVRFPQIKAFSGGQWNDLDFKPPQYFRDETYKKVAEEVKRLNDEGTAVDAVQAEEMYFSASGPAVFTVLSESFTDFYLKSRTRMHNYWKQVSVRRTWFFRKFIEPQYPKGSAEASQDMSIFGEVVPPTAEAAEKAAQEKPPTTAAA